MLTGIERFDSKVFPDPNSGCWLWCGTMGSNGYGHFWNESKIFLSHRMSWMLHVGPITDGKFVLHKCNNRACCNPKHLYLGTQKDNNEDTIRAGRHFFKSGRLNPRPSARLTEDEVLHVFHSIGPQRRIAKRFGVSQATVSEIKTKKIWRHVHGDAT